MTAFQWARLQTDAPSPLRRGAWYRILKLTAVEATVNVKGKPIAVPRAQVQLASEPVLRWSVVPAPKNAPRFPSSWGPRYAVCPNCRERAQLLGEPTTLRCQRCNGSYEVAWDEPYLAKV